MEKKALLCNRNTAPYNLALNYVTGTKQPLTLFFLVKEPIGTLRVDF